MEIMKENDGDPLISRRSRAKQTSRRSSMKKAQQLNDRIEEVNRDVSGTDCMNESDLMLAGIDLEDELTECTQVNRKRSMPLSPIQPQRSTSGKRLSRFNSVHKGKQTLGRMKSSEIRNLNVDKEPVDSESSLFSHQDEGGDNVSIVNLSNNLFDTEKDFSNNLFDDEKDLSNNLFDDEKDLSNNLFDDDEKDLFAEEDICLSKSPDKKSSEEDNNLSQMAKNTLMSIFETIFNDGDDSFSENNQRENSKYPNIEESTSKTINDNQYQNSSKASIPQEDVSVGTSALSLKERLKQKLRQNAGTGSVKKNLEKDIQSEALRKARIDASQIRKEGGEKDIGPFYGLPAKVKQLYEDLRGIKQFYDWQHECLHLPAVHQRQNLLYTLPTSGGKTLVAEILIMKELLCHQRDALLILPFVSIVQEKVQTISEFATELGFLVEEYAGAKGRFPPIKRLQKKALYIATIEKGHSLVNSLLDAGRIGELGLVIVDEVHMIGEGGSRGANLESTMLKLLSLKDRIQIVGMSATLSNLEDLQQFLKAEVYKNDFRPVTLQEYVKVEDNIFRVNNNALDRDEKLQHEKIVTFPYTSEMTRDDPDHLLALVMEVVPSHSCLVFCPTKKNCENVAMMLSKMMCKYHRELTSVNKAKRRQLLAELQQNGAGELCPVLEYTVHFGIAYHHSGLTGDERKVIEEAYSSGVLCLLACTSTLAAGVNLPAKRVILRSPYVGASHLKYSQYKQMVGRAGRAGIDSSGESILIVKKAERQQIKDLLAGPKDYCYSSLNYDEGKGICSLVLSCIGLKLTPSVASVYSLLQASLLSIQCGQLGLEVEALTAEALNYLHEKMLIAEVKDGEQGEGSLVVTELGKATFKGSIDLHHSSQLHSDLLKAQESLYLSSHLHLLYLVTPYDAALTITPDWGIYLNQFCRLSERDVKAATAIGVPESYVNMKASGRHPRKRVPPELTVKRFYLTLVLWELWSQRSVWTVAERFNLPRGYVQNIMTSASAFASCVLHFCQELEELWAYQDLLSEFVKRLGYCTTVELIPLMEVPGVKLARAKQLYAAGYRTVTQLSHTKPSELITTIQHLNLRQAKVLVASAKNVVEEKAAVLMEEVETLVATPRPLVENVLNTQNKDL